MSQDKYPLIKAMGLVVHSVVASNVVFADDLEAKLREAPDVINGDEYETWSEREKVDYVKHHDLFTRKGKVVCIQPIVRDTAESLLRELVELWRHTSYSQYDGPRVTELARRARELLEGK